MNGHSSKTSEGNHDDAWCLLPHAPFIVQPGEPLAELEPQTHPSGAFLLAPARE